METPLMTDEAHNLWQSLAQGDETPLEESIDSSARPLDDDTSEPEEREGELPKIPDILPMVPLRGVVVFPFAVQPLAVGQERSIKLIDDAMRGDRLIGLVAQKDPEIEQGGPDDTYRIGTVARIARLLRLPDN